ncbi:MAG: hypothetical protein U1E78_05850 [Gammaproteobacteria bacterium]
MVSIRHEQGAILIVVMIFSTVMSMLTLLSMENTWLEAKMTKAFSQYIERRLEREKAMDLLEKRFEANPNELLKSGEASLLQFVPDSIHFGERSGLYYYELRVDHIITTQAIESEDINDEEKLLVFSNGTAGFLRIESHHEENHLVLRTTSGAMEVPFAVPLGITTLLATDYQYRGWVDAVYVGDRSGNLWKLDTKPLQYDEWYWQNLAQVEGEIKEIFATAVTGFETPILVVRTSSQSKEGDQLYGLLGSDVIWTQIIDKDIQLKLHRYWLHAGDNRIDVTSGTESLVLSINRSNRQNWRELRS